MTNKQNLPEQLIVGLVAAAMIITPLMYSGKTVNALLFLEIVGACLIPLILWNKRSSGVSKLTLITATCILLTPLLYLIPLSPELWLKLPGRQQYAEALNWLLTHDQTPWLAISLSPQRTLHAFATLIALGAIFFATTSLPEKKQLTLAYLFLGICSLQATIALIQYSNPNLGQWFLGEYTARGSAQGTYLNRDHFSALMHMSLPMAIAFVASNIGTKSKPSDKDAMAYLLQNILIFVFVAMLILLGGIFSRSRAGVFLVIVAVLLSSLVFARHIGGRRSASLAATIAMIGTGLAVSIGLIPVLNRFVAIDPTEDLRWTIFADVIRGIKTFFPVGSGPGTFQDIYRTIQPIEMPRFVNHAHNDYLELLFETGAWGILILTLVLLTMTQGWIQLRNYTWNKYRFMKAAAGISMTLIALHSLVDFNLHTPANAIFVSFLAAIFLSKKKNT